MHRPAHLRFLVSLCLSILLTTSVGVARALPSGLVAWWSGDSNAQDVSGHGHDATLVNGAQAGVPGLIGGAFQMNGAGAFVSTPLLLPSQGTIDVWVKPAALDSIDGIFGTFGLSNGNDRLWISATGAGGGPGVGPNRLAVNLGSCCVNDIDIPTPLTVGTWTHLALTFDYGTDSYALYINGSLAGTSTAARQTPTQSLAFGGYRSDFGQNFSWNGLIDDVHVFNRVLTPAEILGLATPARVHGDLDGDGKADLVWRNTQTGDVVGWLMNGLSLKQAATIYSGVSLDWQIVGVADLDGDGKADLVWRNTQTGDVVGWLMNGLTLKQVATIYSGVFLDWQIAPE